MALVNAYAPASYRAVYEILFAFDSSLAQIIRSTSEPVIGQMRLQWWRDILSKPMEERPLGNPDIANIERLERDFGLIAADLLPIIDGWEKLIIIANQNDQSGNEEHRAYAQLRGGTLFSVIAKIVQPDMDRKVAGEIGTNAAIWALWDLARNSSQSKDRDIFLDQCQNAPDITKKWQKPLRPLWILSKLAWRDDGEAALGKPLLRPSTALFIMRNGLLGR